MSEEIGPDGHEWAKTEAGYAFVQSMIPRAYDKANLMWHGWALREAFVAGAEWQEKRQGQVDELSEDFGQLSRR